MRLIDADALKEAILQERKYIREEEYEIKRGFMLGGLRRALRCLEEAPTVERPRGEWINEGNLHGCSNCGKYSKEYDKPFCCHCGADMRGEKAK